MAAPKRKTHQSRTRTRKRANEKRALPGLTRCPSCESQILPHRACPVCGFYKDKIVKEVEVK